MSDVRAPFPYFGGKRRIAPEIWRRFGDPGNYVEPFAGSLAVLLARPQVAGARHTETVNDADGLLANFWRAVSHAPESVAAWADWPVNECDLHARHLWLIGQRQHITGRLMADPNWHDPKAAGWWVWGISQWIGSGWCAGDGPWTAERFEGGEGPLPMDVGAGGGNAGTGVHRQLPHLGDAGRGVHRQLPHLGDAGRGSLWLDHLTVVMVELAERLRGVRVCCGDWTRVLGPSVTTKHGLTAVLLDPPYSADERQGGLYAHESDTAAASRTWAVEHGDDPLFRIALCGYEGEHAMPDTWEAVPWKAHGGYGSQGEGRGRENAAREVVWFSPHCLKPARTRQLDIFAMTEALA